MRVSQAAQEALTNVLKCATAVAVRLGRRGGELALQVEDNGCGLNAAQADPVRGMANMHARAKTLGGRIGVRSDGRGTCIELHVPLESVVA